MNIKELYYKPPKDKCFEELKQACIRFWSSFPEFHLWDEKQEQLEREYIQSKIDEIKDLKNEGSNFVSMVQMIHPISREVIARLLSVETRHAVSIRLYGWEDGWDEGSNLNDPFNILNVENHR